MPDYLLNAQGNKVWYNKPDDKEHKVGDIWFEKNGIYDRMYVWNGSQWEKRIDTEDVDKIKKEVDKQLEQAKQSTAIEIEKANAKAQEALIKAGTIPDTATLSDQIKTLILNSPDLSRKVTETFNNADNGDTIYSKVYSKVAKNFATKGEFENIDREQNRQGSDLLSLSKKIETQTVEFNKLTESNKLYERILGTSETGAPDQLSRLVMSSQIFQTEVGKYVTDDNNLIVNSMTMSTNTLVGNNDPNANVSVNDGIFTIKAQGLTGYNWTGFTLPIYVKKVYHGETYTLGFKYRIREYPDVSFAFNIKNHGLNKTLTWSNIGENRPPLDEWQEFQKTFTMQEDFAFSEDYSYPFYIFLAKNGWIEFKEPILVRGSNTGPYKPSQFDDAFAETKAVRTQMSLLAGSWAVRNLNSNGDVLNSINVLADGTNRIDGRLTHITGQTKIDNAVIKDGMIANLNADKITGGTIDASQINVININAGNVLAGTLTGMTVRGGRIEGLNGKMYIDLQNSQYNVLNNEATIRRIDDTNSSQFIKLTKSGFVAERFRDSNAALMVLGTNHNKDPKEVERHDNETFAGIRLWSGKGNGTEESLTEFVGDRVLIYNNGRYRSPWNFHGNTNDGNTYLIPMNQNGVKHFIGRGDFFLEGIYSRKFYMSGGIDIGDYIWDLLTCFGEMAKNNMLGGAKNHITGVLRKRGYRI